MKVKSRQHYTIEFKRKVVQESIDSRLTVRAVAARFGVNETTLKSWRTKMTKGQKPPVRNTGPEKSQKALESENRRLKKKLERAELENEILKKANEYFDKLPK